MTGGPAVVAGECDNQPTAATYGIFAIKKKYKAEIRNEIEVQITGNSKKNGLDKIRTGKIIKDETRIVAE